MSIKTPTVNRPNPNFFRKVLQHTLTLRGLLVVTVLVLLAFLVYNYVYLRSN